MSAYAYQPRYEIYKTPEGALDVQSPTATSPGWVGENIGLSDAIIPKVGMTRDDGRSIVIEASVVDGRINLSIPFNASTFLSCRPAKFKIQHLFADNWLIASGYPNIQERTRAARRVGKQKPRNTIPIEKPPRSNTTQAATSNLEPLHLNKSPSVPSYPPPSPNTHPEEPPLISRISPQVVEERIGE